jgi:uncharacterized protein
MRSMVVGASSSTPFSNARMLRSMRGGSTLLNAWLSVGEHVALELRPNCEYCDRDLPPASLEARICTYECTFCTDCVERHLHNVCPNCGGGFAERPIRPAREWRPGLSLAKRPASTKRIGLSFSRGEIAGFVREVAGVPPDKR